MSNDHVHATVRPVLDMLGGMLGEQVPASVSRPTCGMFTTCRRNRELVEEYLEGWVVELETNPKANGCNDPTSDVREFDVPDYIAKRVLKAWIDQHREAITESMAEAMREEW